jgi:hypothetical protein
VRSNPAVHCDRRQLRRPPSVNQCTHR